MKIELHEIAIRDIVENYEDSQENGVVGYNGKLNIRPKYQREFVYNEDKRNAVITTINNGFPLNVMYWACNDDGTFEVIDGQQRTISFCQYITGVFSLNNRFFHNLTSVEKEKILNYKVMVYFCSGNDKEKLDWFKVINIAGEKLTDQELRNAVYSGPWLSDAKLKFSKNNCVAYLLANKYVSGNAIRQEILETAIKWISKQNIENYMAVHQHDSDANQLWRHFKEIIDWTKSTFKVYRKEMKGIDWGSLYDKYHNVKYDVNLLEKEIKKLMMDSDVTNKKGIYQYVLLNDEDKGNKAADKYLNIRSFDENTKREVYEKQNGKCNICHKEFNINLMEADHITPWSEGGHTTKENCQMLCKECNRRKSNN